MTAAGQPAPADAGEAIFTTQLGRSGPHLVFLHGLFGQGKNWTGVAKALSTQYRITLVDLPDHGRSAWTDGFSYLEITDSLVALLTKPNAGPTPGAGDGAGSGGPVHLVGHSMGGKVAMVLALRHPDLIGSLVVVDVAPRDRQRLSGFGRYVDGMRGLDLANIPDRASADAALSAAVPDPTVRSFLLQNLRRHQDPPGWRWQLNLQLLGDQLAEIGGWPDLDVAPYPGPVLWLAGANSDYVTAADAPAMRSLFPRVQLVTVKNSGHWVHAEQPGVFVAAIRRFVHPQ